jgi:TolB protein
MHKILFFIFVLFSQIALATPEYTLFVKTKSPMRKVLLNSVKGANCDPKIFKAICQLLTFDLDNSGHFIVCEEATKPDIQIKVIAFQNKLSLEYKIFESEHILTRSFDDTEKSLYQAVHELADALILAYTGEHGIFSDRIIFTIKDPKSFSSEIFIKNCDLLPPHQITCDRHYKMTPLFLTDGKQKADDILYVSYCNGVPKIFKYSILQKEQTPLIQLRGSQFLPALSQNCDFISFIGDAAGSVDLFVQKIDASFKSQGKPAQLFSYPESVQATSSFHPNQSKIAFVSDIEKRPKIYEIDLLKTLRSRSKADLSILTPKELEATCPAFSSDGKKLAYSSPIDGIRQIMIYDFEEKIHYPLTEGPYHKENPSWAANNLHLAYNTSGEENEIYVINLNQRKPIKITEGIGIKHYPCWERIKKRKIKDSI